jgi:hypothetical protein
MRAARVAAHHDRLAATNAHKKEFADWRQQFVSELDEIVQVWRDSQHIQPHTLFIVETRTAHETGSGMHGGE